ncbi:Gfo/Idh/MocA family protein [Bradyrhizobium japonicum]|uniref:Gfo/Idh/MocA-like oxidoreductase N-terminal domain-containing protein n=1 Tax=Bradyrhizobium japonicum TaxID=375 RepID=A0A1Y2J701_BRAJP|nr:Gfo/Idh/MocA family oxidoreductase [Bradyrhizobium japonicum]OSJ21496.1 hypothetical protein BSZ19_49740 [Bradyrhizobium japonicum]
MSGVTVALVGGGRWGRTHASVLAQLSDRTARILWVSRHNKGALGAFLADLPGADDRFTVVDSLDVALALHPGAAIVATPAGNHAETAELLLRGGVPTLVEKPLALGVDEARRLVDLAAERGIPLLVGLHLLTAPFLLHFLRLSAGRAVSAIELEWLDPEQEIRHGVVKSSNLTTHKVDEIVPHLWSMLHLVDDTAEPQTRTVKPCAQGVVEVEVDMREARATLRFGRRAPARKRRIGLAFRDGGCAELDFTHEPGAIILDGARQPSLETDGRIGPLAVELAGFLDIVSLGQDAWSSPRSASRCMGAVELAEAVRTQLVVAEAAAAAARLARGGSMRDPDISAWVIDNIAPLLDVQEPRTENERRELMGLILDAADMAGPADHVEDDKLRRTMATIRRSDFCGHLNRGLSA